MIRQMKIESIKRILLKKKIVFFESKHRPPLNAANEISPHVFMEIYESFVFKTGTNLNRAVEHVKYLINFMKTVGSFVVPIEAKGKMTKHTFIPHGTLIHFTLIKSQFINVGNSMRFVAENTLRGNPSLTLFRYTYTELNYIIVKTPLLMNLLNLSPMFSSTSEIERVVKQYFKSPSRYAMIRRHSSKK